MTAWAVVQGTIARRRRGWLAMTLGFTLMYYAGLLASVVIRLGHLPNYVTFHDWPGNVLKIIRSTPSVHDMPAIISEEWLVEIGRMNYAYGRGIAEWSLVINPAAVAITLLLGAAVATSVLLLRRARVCCPLPVRGAGMAATGLGVLLVSITNVTVSWAAHCGVASWVVGLALIGIETNAVFALIPYGNLLSGSGFVLLLATIYCLARRCVALAPPAPIVSPGRLVMQDR
jgi:hypothetical protein